MPFTKGRAKTGGRKPGTPNRLSRAVKEQMRALVEHGLATAQADYDRVKSKAPSRALQVLAKFAEFVEPKLGRTVIAGDLDAPPVVVERVVYTDRKNEKPAAKPPAHEE